MSARAAYQWVGLGVICVAARAGAADSEGAASDAQPGFERVAVAEPALPTLAATLGYGFTEPQDDAPGAHHRLSLRLAGAAAPLAWLNVAPAIGARYDLSSGDSSTVVDASLAARAFVPWRTLRLGAELKGWVPGAETASALVDSVSLDARALVAALLGPTHVAFNLGYRFDRSAAAAPHAAGLGPADRLALGVSSFDAVLVGIGTGVELGPNELFGEVSGDILVGSGAPSFAESPLRATAGARRALSRHLTAELVTDVSLSRRPAFDASALVPIEPRVSLLAGIRYRFLPAASTPESAPAPAAEPKVRSLAAPVEATLELAVVDEEGEAVPNVKAVLNAGRASRELTVDAGGRARDEHVPPGAARLALSAPGFEPAERSVVLEPSAPVKLQIELKALPPPSQVRGSVRSFGGTGVVAHVRVEPLGLETTTNESGQFGLDVPPGSYDVVIEAEGYASQRRKVSVEPKGVVILNVDLTQKR